MTLEEQNQLLGQAKTWFAGVFMENHKTNTIKLAKLKPFKINPFLHTYLAAYFAGVVTPHTLAQVLLLPRVLGTSPTTSFGTVMQAFTTEVLKEVFGSTTQGVDIEFVDAVTHEKTYCQVKLGPTTINKSDVKTIADHFTELRALAKTNKVALKNTNLVVGVIYGEPKDLSANYKTLQKKHCDVFVGKDFWHRLTGAEDFYDNLIKAFGEVAITANCKQLLDDVTHKLAKQINL
jgi:hypothetical protein